MNICVFTGNVATDPELRGPGGSVLVFRLAADSRRFNPQTQAWEDRADFIDCVMRGNRAAAVGAWLAKGAHVTVQASARQNTWKTEGGESRSRIEFACDDLVPAPRR